MLTHARFVWLHETACMLLRDSLDCPCHAHRRFDLDQCLKTRQCLYLCYVCFLREPACRASNSLRLNGVES
jgi:hypothetical protein